MLKSHSPEDESLYTSTPAPTQQTPATSALSQGRGGGQRWGGQGEQLFKKRLGLGLRVRPGTSQTPNHHMGHKKERQ